MQLNFLSGFLLQVQTTEYTPLIKLNVTLPSPIDPSIILQQNSMAELSEYFDIQNNITTQFDCARIEGDLSSVLGCIEPIITSVTTADLTILGQQDLVEFIPSGTVGAGTDQPIVLVGQCFGNGDFGKLQLLNGADDIPFKVTVKEEDILAWEDDIISFLLPSDVVESNMYPRSGPIWVDRTEENMGVGQSSNLGIDFVLTNYDVSYTVQDGSLVEHSAPASNYGYLQLEQFGESRGYYYTFTESFASVPERVEAFEFAMDIWRCTYSNINMKYISQLDIVLQGVSPESVIKICMEEEYEELTNDSFPITAIASTFYNANQSNIPLSCLLSGPQKDVPRWLNGISFTQNPTNPYYYGVDLPTDNNVTDFISVCLHELGHMHHLRHTDNFTLMDRYYEYNYRDVSADANYGAQYSMQSSIARLTANNDCSAFPMTYFDCFANSIPDHNHYESNILSLYPNPTLDLLTIELPLKHADLIDHVTVINSLGQKVGVNLINSRSGQIDLAHLSSGIYQVHITMKSGLSVVRSILKTDHQ